MPGRAASCLPDDIRTQIRAHTFIGNPGQWIERSEARPHHFSGSNREHGIAVVGQHLALGHRIGVARAKDVYVVAHEPWAFTAHGEAGALSTVGRGVVLESTQWATQSRATGLIESRRNNLEGTGRRGGDATRLMPRQDPVQAEGAHPCMLAR